MGLRNGRSWDVAVCAACAAMVLGVVPGVAVQTPAMGAVAVEWDFSTGTHGWRGNGRVEAVRSTPDGLVVRSTGVDPWIEGPAVDLPADGLVRLTLRVRATEGDGAGQVFYGPGFSAERVRNVPVSVDGAWHDYTVMIDGAGIGARTRFRFDPCSEAGLTMVRFIRVEVLAKPEAPVFSRPVVPRPGAGASRIRSGDLVLSHAGDRWGAFVVRYGGRSMACGYTEDMIGVQFEGRTQWLALSEGAAAVRMDAEGRLEERLTFRDGAGGTWALLRTFERVPGEAAIRFATTVRVDRDRDAVLVPWLTLLPGLGSFGSAKHQGLFAGLEYLADEPSSSTADITGPDHVRRIPEPYKITFPLMAVEHQGVYVGLIWQRSSLVAAGFDSPDRVFGSGVHAMWLSGPGVGVDRQANDLVAMNPMRLAAGQAVSAEGMIIAGRGSSVVAAVQQYVRLRALPPLPRFEGGLDRAVELLSHGWLDSAINRDWLFRHAVWGGSFGPSRAADAAMYMRWLAGRTNDADLRRRLNDGVAKTLARLGPNDPYASGVSHIRLPAGPLWFGRVGDYVRQRRERALRSLDQFGSDGRVVYRPSGGRPDYGRTHFADHANGLTSAVLVEILQAATLCGDRELTERALAVLDKQAALYANTVPRGAQTWEVPLHTPDILASAHLVDCYVYGYLLSGREEYLEQARYWAWTGVPFVYLENPTDGPVGPYATVAVLGATNWRAPVWFGQPVQWCGLVYGSALHRLAEVDPGGPWRPLAQGITLAGLQMVWPESDGQRQGLLPDYFLLGPQKSEGPAINPGTVGGHLAEAYGAEPLYDVRAVRSRGWIVHAPCRIRNLTETESEVRFDVAGSGTYYVLVAGVREMPRVRCISGRLERPSTPDTPDQSPDAVVEYDPAGRLVLRMTGASTLSIRP